MPLIPLHLVNCDPKARLLVDIQKRCHLQSNLLWSSSRITVDNLKDSLYIQLKGDGGGCRLLDGDVIVCS